MRIKRKIRRALDDLKHSIEGEKQDGYSMLGSLITKPWSSESHEYLGVPYHINVKKFTFSDGYTTSAFVDGIQLPRFPRNLTASLLITDIFRKMILDYGDRNQFVHGCDVSVTYRDKTTHPCYVIDEASKGHVQAKNTIEVFKKHEEKLSRLLKTVEDEYPTNREESGELIRRLQLPLWGGYSDENLKSIMVHPYSGCITAERSKIFDENPMQWYVEESYSRLEDDSKMRKLISHSPTDRDMPFEEGIINLVMNLKHIEHLGLARVDWNRIERSFPGAGAFKIDLRENSEDLKSMFWMHPFFPIKAWYE